MNNAKGAIREVVEGLFEKASCEIFNPVQLALDSIVMDASACTKQVVGDSVLSVLSASGNGIKILSSINASISDLQSLFPHSDTPSIDEVRDWCGELNNQIVGAAKNHLLAYDCKVMMGLPTLVQGENLASIGANEASVSKRVFNSPKGQIITYLATVIAPGLEIRDSPDDALTGLNTSGELDFF